MSDMADVLEDHRDLAWNHVTGQAICADCDEPLGPFTADIDEQNKWLRQHQAAALSAAGFGPVRAMPRRITQELLDDQRTKGWVDWHPEDYCHRCYETNVSWYVDTQPWTDVMRGGNPDGWGLWQEIICIPCFTSLADEHYGSVQAWTVARDRGSYALQRVAGFGPVQEARAGALEDAADVAAEGGVPAYDSDDWATWLRARAVAERANQ